MLFASASGRRMGDKICELAREWTDVDFPEEVTLENIKCRDNAARKKLKSDIKNLIHEAHSEKAHTEQGFEI